MSLTFDLGGHEGFIVTVCILFCEGALRSLAQCVFCPCRPARVLTRRQWRVSEPRWLHGKRWRPTWSLSWQLLGPRLPHTSTGEYLRMCLVFYAAAGRDLAVSLSCAAACLAWKRIFMQPRMRPLHNVRSLLCLSCAEYGSWRVGCCAWPCERHPQRPCAAAGAAPVPRAAPSLVRTEYLLTSQPSL